MELQDNIDEIINETKDVCLVAATKYVDSFDMLKLLDCGINNFGENRVDSFLEKYDQLKDKNIVWHFIGHLQRNKALKVIDKIDYLHSLDSLKLAKIINDNIRKPLNCFIEVNLNKEESKDGVYLEDLDEFVLEVIKYPKINVVGLMTMTMKNDSSYGKLNQFELLNNVKNRLNEQYNLNLKYLSMGMSDDYKQALKASSTHVRLGRILWKS